MRRLSDVFRGSKNDNLFLFIYVCRFTDDDVDEMYREAPIKGAMFDYIEFTRILKHGAKDKDEQWASV